MSLSPRFCSLPALALACLLALPAAADVPSPEGDIREGKVEQWHRAYPGTAPAMEAALSPDGKAMLLRITAKIPTSYTVRVDGKIAAKGRIAELKGGVQTESISLAEHPGEQGVRIVHVDYSLRGVAQEDGVLRKTDDLIAGCLRARYGMATSSGKTVLKVVDLDEEDADILNRCGL